MSKAGEKASFFSSEGMDPFYRNIRDNPARIDARKFIEQLWQKYAPYAEPGFLDKAKNDLHASTWEMYLGCILLDYDFNLKKKTKEEGPDIQLLVKDRSIWIEAVAPTSGTGEDAVPDAKGNFIVRDVPDEKIILRLTGAIKVKYEQYKNYKSNNLIGPNDYYVIAVNGGRIPLSLLERDIPFIVMSVLPFGDLVIKKTKGIINSYHKYRNIIKKISGGEVQTNIFENREYSGISTVIYSNANVVNHPELIGVEIQCIHNPLAANKLPLGIFPFGTEWWVENNYLRKRKAAKGIK